MDFIYKKVPLPIHDIIAFIAYWINQTHNAAWVWRLTAIYTMYINKWWDLLCNIVVQEGPSAYYVSEKLHFSKYIRIKLHYLSFQQSTISGYQTIL